MGAFAAGLHEGQRAGSSGRGGLAAAAVLATKHRPPNWPLCCLGHEHAPCGPPHFHPRPLPLPHPHPHRTPHPQFYGTCLGFETLAVIASKNHSILSKFDAEDNAAPLYPTELAPKSRFFRWVLVDAGSLPGCWGCWVGAGAPQGWHPAGRLGATARGGAPQKAGVFVSVAGAGMARAVQHACTTRFDVPPPRDAAAAAATALPAAAARCRTRCLNTCRRSPMPWRTTRTVGEGGGQGAGACGSQCCGCCGRLCTPGTPTQWPCPGGDTTRLRVGDVECSLPPPAHWPPACPPACPLGRRPGLELAGREPGGGEVLQRPHP